MDCLCNSMSEISNVCKAVECLCLCLEAMTIVHHHANGRFDWLISEHQSVSPSREAIFVLSGKYKRSMFVLNYLGLNRFGGLKKSYVMTVLTVLLNRVYRVSQKSTLLGYQVIEAFCGTKGLYEMKN